jgi:hypothetical protein
MLIGEDGRRQRDESMELPRAEPAGTRDPAAVARLRYGRQLPQPHVRQRGEDATTDV